MDKHLIQRIFKDFKNIKALVIGDVMIDSYYRGNADRISPEAPVPVISVTQREDRPGGAANVAKNIASLGADVYLCACIGDDNKGELFTKLMAEEGLPTAGILTIPDRTTTSKTRIISRQQQLLRVDEEETTPLTFNQTQEMLERVSTLISKHDIDVVIFEDYDKGLITKNLIEGVVKICNDNGIPVTADPKKDRFWAYKNITLFKPNLKELVEGFQMKPVTEPDISYLDEAFNKLKREMGISSVLITLSEFGVYYNDGEVSKMIPAHMRKISDVSGAGDTVISVASLCLTLGHSLELASQLANLAGGLVCEEPGVVPINPLTLHDEAVKVLAV